jgi:hypothetical protein
VTSVLSTRVGLGQASRIFQKRRRTWAAEIENISPGIHPLKVAVGFLAGVLCLERGNEESGAH